MMTVERGAWSVWAWTCGDDFGLRTLWRPDAL